MFFDLSLPEIVVLLGLGIVRDDLKPALPHPLDPHPVAEYPDHAPPPGTAGTVAGAANLHEIT